MSSFHRIESAVNLRIFNPSVEENWEETYDQIEGLDTPGWILDQAERFRLMGSDLADLLADRLEAIADDWRVLSQGEPITVDEFRAREEIMRELEMTHESA